MHGKTSMIDVDNQAMIFKGLKDNIQVARYHSLIANKDTLPSDLKVIGKTQDGEVMAVKHKDYPIYGLQFHPESILTPDGMLMIKNFLGGKDND
jgi:anthranilate synthase component 2